MSKTCLITRKGRFFRPFFFAFYAAFLVFTFSKCKDNQKGIVDFGYGHSYLLSGNERLAGLDSALVKDYERIVNHYPNLNIPLTRLIVADRYKLFVGICIDGKISDLKKALALDSSWRIIRSEGKRIFAKSKEQYLVLNIHDNGADPPYCITFSSPDSLLSDSVVSGKERIFNRFSFYAEK